MVTKEERYKIRSDLNICATLCEHGVCGNKESTEISEETEECERENDEGWNDVKDGVYQDNCKFHHVFKIKNNKNYHKILGSNDN